ncbi:carboxypeptidase regulatory-like domain-containing protein [Carboxylicivirga mesophila]|uniref:Carboxypeptidase regulatory-like domain-containing protein n=1 Tax=Carboxylicivirga mesophila TaxID=1166478 RepID=A0ABS5KFM4_9BACT|nr:carboxypeptidase regulatory-like domain-containing protein [Carboxylicivirga mesophila]MBS2213864.1 carboxypeptidase regulatory-like domain-containing protein [Carboxylicivirga mesophila]
MKRFTMLLAVFCLLITSMMAQDLIKSHTQTGSVSEVLPYSTGMVYISNDGSNDVISYTTDGITFNDTETLVTGSVAGLNSWSDGTIAFYLGDTDGSGAGLRKLDGGTASLVDGPNPVDATKKPSSGVLRYTGADNPLYFYNYADGFDPISGTTYLPSYTDGSSLNTALANSYSPYTPNSKPIGTMYNNKLYIAGATGGFFPTPIIYEFDGSIIKEVYSGTEQVFYNFKAVGNSLFFLQGNPGEFSDAVLFSMDADGNVTRMTDNGMDVMVNDELPMIANGWDLYGIVNGKLTKIAFQFGPGGGWTYTPFHLNAQGESDNISDMVMSGGNIYVLAATTGNETELFTINPTSGTYVNSMPDAITASNTYTSLTAIDGGVAFVGNNGTSDVVYVSDGHSGTTKMLTVENDPTLAINHMYSTGDKLYMFAENGADTDIYEYSVMPFASQTVTITVIDAVTKAPIQYASVAIETGLERISWSSNADGEVMLENVPDGIHQLEITASGYASFGDEITVDVSNTSATYELKAGQEVTVSVRDFHTNEQLADVTVTFEGTDGVKWSQTIVPDLMWGGVTNNIFSLAQDTYTVTIERDGYVTYVESDVMVEAGTSTLNFVITLPTISFNLQLCDASGLPEQAELPVAASGTVTLTHSMYPTIKYEVTTINVGGGMVPDMILAQFSDVPYGTYNVVATAPGFQDKSTTYVVDAESNTPPNDKIYLDPIPTGIEDTELTNVRVYPNPAVDFIVFESANAIQSVEIYSVNGAKVKALNNDKITRINISELPKGLYLVATTDSNGQRQITKINKR